ncbi:hypothetical protein J4E89_001572 [Alternaria sp. Ai002NY15]|nr:hypothetical protein J4E89_001572 [Alternaria sp. Ai002NY15]
MFRRVLEEHDDYTSELKPQLEHIEEKLNEVFKLPQTSAGELCPSRKTVRKTDITNVIKALNIKFTEESIGHYLSQLARVDYQQGGFTEHQTHEADEEYSSEFEELVNKISELKAKIPGCLEEVDSLCHNFVEATPGTAEERDAVERVRKIVADIENRYQEIDTHYGWVLASDRELRDEVLSSYFGKKLDGKVWLKRSIRMLKQTRRILEMSQQRVF